MEFEILKDILNGIHFLIFMLFVLALLRIVGWWVRQDAIDIIKVNTTNIDSRVYDLERRLKKLTKEKKPNEMS